MCVSVSVCLCVSVSVCLCVSVSVCDADGAFVCILVALFADTIQVRAAVVVMQMPKLCGRL